MTLKIWGFATTPLGSSGGEYLVTPRPSAFYAEIAAAAQVVPGVTNDPDNSFGSCVFLELVDDGTGHSIDVSDETGAFPVDLRYRQEIAAGGSEVLAIPPGRSIRVN